MTCDDVELCAVLEIAPPAGSEYICTGTRHAGETDACITCGYCRCRRLLALGVFSRPAGTGRTPRTARPEGRPRWARVTRTPRRKRRTRSPGTCRPAWSSRSSRAVHYASCVEGGYLRYRQWLQPGLQPGRETGFRNMPRRNNYVLKNRRSCHLQQRSGTGRGALHEVKRGEPHA